MGVPRAADRGPVFLEHRGEHAETRTHGQLKQLRAAVHQQIDERQVTKGIDLGERERLCKTFASWRLLLRGFRPRFGHQSYSTTSEEPPLSTFNSYWDISSSDAIGYLLAVVRNQCNRL